MADRTGRQRVSSIVAALAATVPGLTLDLSALSLAHPAKALIYGVYLTRRQRCRCGPDVLTSSP